MLRAAAEWVDVIAVQRGPEGGSYPGAGRDELEFPEESLRAIHRATAKPVLIEGEAWDRTESYVMAAAQERFIVGYQRCQYRSRPCAWRDDMLKQGLLRVDGYPYPLSAERAQRLNHQARECWATGAIPGSR